jgi:hypothetical protein
MFGTGRIGLGLRFPAAGTKINLSDLASGRDAFISEDFQKALAERASNALMGSGLVSIMAMSSYPDKILLSAKLKGGGKQFEVVVPCGSRK